MSNKHYILQSLWAHSFNVGFSPSQCTEACKKGGSIECDTNSGSCQCMKTGNCDTNSPVCYKCDGDLCSSLLAKCGPYTPPADTGLNNYCDARNTICGTRTGNCDIYKHPELVNQCVKNGGEKGECTMYMDGDGELDGHGSICSGGDHPDPDAPGGWSITHKIDLHHSIVKSSPPGTKNVDAIATCVVTAMVNSGYTYTQVKDVTSHAVQVLITKSLSGCIQHNGGIGGGSHSSDGSGLSTGAIIGIIAGSVVFLIAVFLLLRKRKRS